jgi:hypothetical protein
MSRTCKAILQNSRVRSSTWLVFTCAASFQDLKDWPKGTPMELSFWLPEHAATCPLACLQLTNHGPNLGDHFCNM